MSDRAPVAMPSPPSPCLESREGRGMESEVAGRACSEAGGAVCKGSCGRVHQAVEQGESGQVGRVEVTGWPPGMLQDDSKELSKWLASKPDAKQQVREACAQIRAERVK